MKKIDLLHGLFALVDDDDHEKLSRHLWHAGKGGSDTFYAVRYIRKGNATIRIYMHREILNAPADKDVDHRDGHTLDNRKSNLRLCDPSTNQANSRLPRTNTSGYRGVSLDKALKSPQWRARIKYRQKEYWLGYFPTKEAAARAYNAKAKELFGEFARLNPV